MADELLNLESKPAAKQLIAGWRRQWSDGGEVSGGLPAYLINKLGAVQIGEMGPEVSKLCYPFQVPGTHDTYRPRAAYSEGLPSQPMTRSNRFYDAGNGLIIFLGQEPWFRIDVYAEAFFQAVAELDTPKIIAVEGYNGAAPPEMERSVSCIYSRADMKAKLDNYGLRYSNYGTQSRNGPTIAMALVTLAHYEHPEMEMLRLGAMAPMYPFLTPNNDPVGISRDHRAFYDIMRRIKAMFDLDVDLSELLSLGEAEPGELVDTLEKIASTNSTARELIDRAKADYNYVPFETVVSLEPGLDRTLEDILRNAPDQPENG
ncbi:MAG: PAC2 family protein [Chloroflexi bacterium]|nr:PAC2 family protein [Chloroflexota bacterium]